VLAVEVCAIVAFFGEAVSGFMPLERETPITAVPIGVADIVMRMILGSMSAIGMLQQLLMGGRWNGSGQTARRVR
jgi:hypothetical protein